MTGERTDAPSEIRPGAQSPARTDAQSEAQPDATSGARSEAPADARSPARRRYNAIETRGRLLAAARAVVCEVGVAAASARMIASRAGVTQALIFYHFGTVADLVAAASNHAVDASFDHYRDALDRASTVDDLLAVARRLHDREGSVGNVAFMTQILAAAPHDAVIADAARYAVTTWTGAVRGALDRLLGGTALADIVEVDGLAQLVSAAFIGLELQGSTDPDAADAAMASLASIARLVDAIGGAGPIARRVLAAARRRL